MVLGGRLEWEGEAWRYKTLPVDADLLRFSVSFVAWDAEGWDDEGRSGRRVGGMMKEEIKGGWVG